MRFTLALCVLAFSALAYAQVAVVTPPSDIFQISYATNLNQGDSFINITNSGNASVDGAADQNLCANVYTFDPAEELISCCSCVVTPNALQSLSVLKSLISNPLTPAIPTSVTIAIIASIGSPCNANGTVGVLTHGMLAWSTTLHQNTSTATPSYSVTEIPFQFAVPTTAEIVHLTSTCGFIQSNGSGFGICAGCAAGGLGAPSTNQ